MAKGNIPNQTYVFPDVFAEYVKKQLGVIAGHQGFDNNVLMAEAYSKLMPQVQLAYKRGKFDNIYTRQKPKKGLDETAYRKLDQIWRIGNFFIVIRDENDVKVTNREVIYPIPEGITITKGKGKDFSNFTYNDVWERIEKCHLCHNTSYVQLSDEDLQDLFPTGIVFCPYCGYEEEVEIEVKPSLKEMELCRPKHSSPIWREMQGEVPVRYGLEDVDLDNLTSEDGGYYKEYVDISGKVPRYKTIHDILNSDDTTSFPCKQYYESSMHRIFSEFLHYWNIHLLDIDDLLVHQTQQYLFEMNSNRKRQKLVSTLQQE